MYCPTVRMTSAFGFVTKEEQRNKVGVFVPPTILYLIRSLYRDDVSESKVTSRLPIISSSQNLKKWKTAYIVQKPQTLGWVCSGSGINSLKFCLRKLLFTSERLQKKTNCDGSFNHYPKLTLHTACFRAFI